MDSIKQQNFVPGGCVVSTPAAEESLGGLGAAGGLASAAASGNLGAALKSMLKARGIELAQQAATGLLTKLFTTPVAPKPPKPPWPGLGEVASPGSAAATSAMEAYNAAHNAPVISSGAACPATAPAGGSGAGTAGQGAPPTGPQSAYPYDPRGEPAMRDEWEQYLGLPSGFLPEYDPENPDAFDYLDTWPLEDPWYADFLGGNMDDGYTALFGLVELGSPKWPGAGTHGSWWVPDKLFGYDMSPYYAWHDQRFDSSRGFGDIGEILAVEALSFMQGLSRVKDPIHLGLQVIYSSATTLAAFVFATQNAFSENRGTA